MRPGWSAHDHAGSTVIRDRDAAARCEGLGAALYAAARKRVQARRAGARAQWCLGAGHGGPQCRHCRRVRFRQIDLCAAGDGAGTANVRLGVADGPRPAPHAGRRASPRPARFPDGVSGSLRIAGPAADGCAHRCRTRDRAGATGSCGAARADCAGAAAGGAARRRYGQVSARILRRAAAAHRDRARADHPAEADCRR